MGQPDGMTLPQWLSAAVLDQRQRAEFLRTLAAAMPDGQALLDLAEWIDRDVDAKWAILELHRITVERVRRPPFDPFTGERLPDEYDVECEICGWVSHDPTSACPTVRHLGTMYADRDGYNPSWRPE